MDKRSFNIGSTVVNLLFIASVVLLFIAAYKLGNIDPYNPYGIVVAFCNIFLPGLVGIIISFCIVHILLNIRDAIMSKNKE